jgi:beta-lactamase regulating signal transducer with metallopeptidase domain
VPDLLLQTIVSNLLVSTLLAGVAWIAQRRLRSAALVNLLWVIVLVKLVTPPLFVIPAVHISKISNSGSEQITSSVASSEASLPAEGTLGSVSAIHPSRRQPDPASVSAVSPPSRLVKGALAAWISVSAMLFLFSTVRIIRFNRLLKAHARPAPRAVSEIAQALAERFGLRRAPRIVLSGAQITPFVWWLGGQPRITISEQAVHGLSRDDLELVIAHEMAHIKRRDHWVRWLEWFTVNLVWWNPVMWWARAQLRISEEIACDNLVLESLESERPRYANALLNMADLLTSPAIRPPAVASAIDSGGDLEKRLMMIIAEKTGQAPAALRLVIFGMAVCVLPLGLVYGQDVDAVERRLGTAVGAGELSLDQARLMLDALQKSAGSADRQTRDSAAPKNQQTELERKIKAGVEGGELSPLQAKKLLGAVHEKMPGSTKFIYKAVGDRDPAALKGEMDAIERKLKAAVDEGKYAEAKKLFGAIHEKLPGSTNFIYKAVDDTDPAALKREIEIVERKFKAAVDEGKLSPPEADGRLGALHRKMPGQNNYFYMELTDRDPAALKSKFEAINRKLKAATDQGKLSPPAAKNPLGAIHEKMPAPNNFFYMEPTDHDPAALKTEFEAIERKIKAAVEHGKLSPAEAKRALGAIHQEIFGSSNDQAPRD